MPRNLVFITGATGFIGGHILATTLRAGYRVRLSIRRTDQIQKLNEVFSDFTDQLDFIVIPDFTIPGAFVEALRGVDYVVHIASPMLGQGIDFRTDFVDPAVQGTLSILNAAKSNPSVKRVLIMSSILALVPIGALQGPPISVQENSRTKINVDLDMEIPDGPAGHGTKYQGSKILAHQATTDWVESHKPEFLVLTFHPTFVIGPSLFQRKAGDIDSINRFFFDTVRTGTPIIPPVLVDVRDVADAFVKALVASVPKQQEFTLSGPPTTWVEVCSEVQSLYPDEGFKSGPPDEEQPSMTVSTRVARELLGIQWKSVRELVCGVIDQQLALKAQPA